ncbi:MAG TPA: APC family permease [Acetobacteraceae bacterium]
MSAHSATTDAASPFRLSKVLGVLAITASAVAAEYGAGINFVSTQSLGVYPDVHGLVPLAMFVTGILVLPKTYIFIAFSRVIPRAGSKYVWAARSLGLPVGFLAAFIWWITGAASIGVLSFAFGTFISQALNGIVPGLGAGLVTPVGHLIVGLVAIWGCFAVNASGVRHYGAFVVILFAIICAVALIIMAYGFTTSPDTFLAAASKVANVTLAPPTTSEPDNWWHFISVCSLFIFAYAGLSAGPSLGGEVHDPHTTLPRGIMFGWIVALVLFSGVAAALFHAAPWWAVLGLMHAHKAAYATAPGLIGLVAPQWLSVVLNLAVALIVGKTIAPGLMVGSRTAFAWGQDGMFSPAFADTSSRKVPMAGIWLMTILGSLALLQSVIAGWALGVAVRAITVLAIWLALAVGILMLRWHPRFRQLAWASQIADGPLVLLAALVSIIVTVPLMASLMVAPHAALIFQPWLQGIIVIVAGLIVLWFARRRLAARGESFNDVMRQLPIE